MKNNYTIIPNTQWVYMFSKLFYYNLPPRSY